MSAGELMKKASKHACHATGVLNVMIAKKQVSSALIKAALADLKLAVQTLEEIGGAHSMPRVDSEHHDTGDGSGTDPAV